MRDDELQALAEDYRQMGDAELKDTALEYGELVEPAQALLRSEFERRSLAMPRREETQAERFARMTETDLMAAARGYDALDEATQALLRREFKRKRLEPPLVEGEEEEQEPAPPLKANPVTVARYRDLSEAIVARSVLEQAGIGCLLRDENTVRMDWAISNMLGGMRLQVGEEDAADALALLSQPMPASFAVDAGPVFEQPVCPRCGSLDVTANNTKQKLGLASTLVGGLPVVLAAAAMATQRDDLWKCNACGCKWYDDGEEAGPDAASLP